MTTLRDAMQQALEALEKAVVAFGPGLTLQQNAITALRAALVEQKCPCGDRQANQCPGEWEPGCDLGANPKHAKVAAQAQPVAWMVEGEGLYWTEEAAICRADMFAEPLDVVPLYAMPPALIVPQQPLRDLCAAAYQVVGVAGGPVEMLDNLVAAADGKPLPHDPGAGLPWMPAPQPLAEQDDDLTAAWMAGAAEERKRAEQAQPVAAQHRFRHPQKGTPDWSVWQPCKVAQRPAWEIDSQGYEVEYRALYTSPQPAPVAPPGWRMVPEEPTQEMAATAGPGTFWIAEAKRTWRTMVAAAPEAPTPPTLQPLTIERLQKALVGSRVVPPEAVEDPDNYDDGVMLSRIEALHRRLV